MNRQLLQYHPTFGHHFVPGLKARVDHEAGGFLLRTNDQGFRCHHDFTAAKRPGVFRVLLFGDSYTAGDGVSNTHRYSDVLESLLPNLEVFNFGLSGTGTDQQYLVFREVAKDIEHDLIVVGLMVENIRRIVVQYRPWATPEGKTLFFAKPYFTFDKDRLTQHNVPVPKEPIDEEALILVEGQADRGGRLAWARKAVNQLGPSARDLVQRLSRYQPVPAYDQASDPSWLLMRAILDRWASESTAPIVVCPIPLYQHIEETASPAGYQRRLQEWVTSKVDADISLHDPLADFQSFDKETRRGFRFEHDTHLTAAGHKVLAESLSGCLRSFMKG